MPSSAAIPVMVYVPWISHSASRLIVFPIGFSSGNTASAICFALENDSKKHSGQQHQGINEAYYSKYNGMHFYLVGNDAFNKENS